MVLPKGWKREEHIRRKGLSIGKVDISIKSPNGTVFRSKKALAAHIHEKKLPFNINDFDFSTKKKTFDRSSNKIDSTLSENSKDTSFDLTNKNTANSSLSSSVLSFYDNKSDILSTTSSSSSNTVSSSAQTDTSSPLMATCGELLSRNWLSDDTLRNYFEILDSKFHLADKSCHILNPLFSHIIKNIIEFEHFLERLHLEKFEYLIIPINDATSLDKAGGSHWSVLFFDKPKKTFFYFDSSQCPVLHHAQTVADKLMEYLGLNNMNPVFSHASFPTQINGYDCAIYTIMAIENLILGIVGGSGPDLNQLGKLKISEIDLIKKRSYVAYILNNHIFTDTDILIAMMKEISEENFVDTLKKRILDLEKELNGGSRQNINTLESSTDITESKNLHNEQKHPSLLHSTVSSNIPNNPSWTSVPDKIKGKNGGKFARNTKKFCHQNAYVKISNRFNVLTQNDEDNDDDDDDDDVLLTEKDGSMDDTVVEKMSPSTHVTMSRAKKFKFSEKHLTKGSKNISSFKRKNLTCLNLKISLCSDSQGKDLYRFIDEQSNGMINAFCHVMANSSMSYILDAASSEEDTPLIVLGGTNNSLDDNLNDIYSKLEHKLAHLSSRRPVFITTIPVRHDLPLNHRINKELATVNNYIAELTLRMNNVALINLNGLGRFHFTKHGLHLNKHGKSKLASLIVKALASWSMSKKNTNIIKGTMNHFKSKPKDSSAASNVKLNQDSSFTIIEGDMSSFADKFCNDVSTAFAHCISADFHMGQGVALSMKRRFGRPLDKDCISHHLSYQKLDSGASVYGLITKPKYFHKPYVTRYNNSFKHFQQDFQKKKFLNLICSPMGCIRDGIPLHLFSKNIVKFQHTTQARIFIVANDENPGGTLKNGLTYVKFLKQLQGAISQASGSTIKIVKSEVFLASLPPINIKQDAKSTASMTNCDDGTNETDDISSQHDDPPALPISSTASPCHSTPLKPVSSEAISCECVSGVELPSVVSLMQNSPSSSHLNSMENQQIEPN
jgi:sentrin-specific protease 8